MAASPALAGRAVRRDPLDMVFPTVLPSVRRAARTAAVPLLCLPVFFLGACRSGGDGPPVSAEAPEPTVREEARVALPDGREVRSFTLEIPGRLRVRVHTLGAAVQSIETPDRGGRYAAVFRGPAPALATAPPPGATVGRVAHVVPRGRFRLEGQTVRLPLNAGPSHRDGGPEGLHSRVFEARVLRGPGAVTVEMKHRSPHGAGGYPGNVELMVLFTLEAAGTLEISEFATADRKTPLALARALAFDLGARGALAEGVTLQVPADRQVDMVLGPVPTGETSPLDGTAYDLSQPRPTREVFPDRSGGHDVHFVLEDPEEGGRLHPAVLLADEASGRRLSLVTTKPTLRVATGDRVQLYGPTQAAPGAIVLAPQAWPAALEHEDFPSIVLGPGQTYDERTRYTFWTER